MKQLFLLLCLVAFSMLGNSQIIINEVQADAGNFENSGGEWIELKNLGSSAVDMSCWKLTNGSFDLSIPFGLTLAPNGYLLIGNASKMMCNSCDYHGLLNQFNAVTLGYYEGTGDYINTLFLNTDVGSNGGCDCLTGNGTFNNGAGTGDRIVLVDDQGNLVDGMMYGGGNNYGSGDLTVNFNSTPTCAPLSGIVVPNTSSPLYVGRTICNDVASCNSSFARLPDANNPSIVTWSQTGNLACNNCTNPCGAQTNTASDDMPTPGLPNGTSSLQVLLNGSPLTSNSASITVCGATPVNFQYEIGHYTNMALTATQGLGNLGSYTSTNNGTPTNFTNATFNPATGITTLSSTLIPGPGTTTFTYVMGDANTNCAVCPGTPSTTDVENVNSAAKECYIVRKVTVTREEALEGLPVATCSILGSIIVNGATGTNLKYELQKQTTVGGPFTTIAGPQNGNSFSGIVDDDADPLLPNYQVVVTTQNTVCANPTGIIVAVPGTCLGNPACAIYVLTNPGPTFSPASGSTVCAESPVQFSVEITGVCTNGTVEMWYDYNPGFNPYTSGTLLGSTTTTVGPTPATTVATGKVFINEIAPRPQLGACSGTPNGSNPNSGEWVELYNAGPGNVDLGGWILSDGDWTATIPAGTTLIAGNHFLIGGGGTFCSIGQLPDLNIETCNCATVSPTTQDIMNLTDGNEQVALFDCTGTFIDGVLWNNGQSIPDATANNAPATGCGNYITAKNVSLPAAASFSNSGASLSGNPNQGRYRNAVGNTWTTTTTTLLNATPKATNPGGNWNGATVPFGSQCPPPSVNATMTVNLPDTCSQTASTNITLKAIYKPEPVFPCTQSDVTATATYTIPSCSLLTLSGDGEYCVPNLAPVTLTPSDPLVGNYDVTLGNGSATVTINGLSGTGPFIGTVATSGTWVINNIVPPAGTCAPKKVGSAQILINAIPAVATAPDTMDFCYLYGYDLSNIEPLITTNPPANVFKWFDAAVGGNQVFPTLVNPSATTTYYVEPSTGFPAFCDGARVPIVLQVIPIPDEPLVSCINNIVTFTPPTPNCIPTPCNGVEYSPDATNWSANTSFGLTDPGWAGWGSPTYSTLYIRNTSLNSCYNQITYIGPCTFPLPATLSGFTGHLLANRTVQINWQVSAQHHVKYFELERGSHKGAMEKIARIESHGLTTSPDLYQQIDVNPFGGSNYYRLKIVDEDGSYTYSNTIMVELPVSDWSVGSVFPNPALDQVQIEIQSEKGDKTELEVLDALGHVVYQSKENVEKGSNLFSIKTNHLAKGQYILKCSNAKQTAQRRFVVQ